MAAKLMEIVEILQNEYHLYAWVYGDLRGWKIKVFVPGDGIYEYLVEPGIVSPYRTAADVAREIAEEVKQYVKG